MRTSSFLSVMRNFGGLLATLYVVGAFFNKGMSQARQEKSLVRRTYQAKLLTDKEMNCLLGMENMPEDEETAEDYDQTSIINGLYKLLIARQRLPKSHARAARLFAKGRRRVQADLDVVN